MTPEAGRPLASHPPSHARRSPAAPASLVAVWSPYLALALFGVLEVFHILGSSLFERD